MMSMFTFVVVMVALGTVVQRADVVSRIFGEGVVAIELRRDEVILRANELTGIDVLANDVGLRTTDRERLVVVEQPGCGRVFVRDGKAHYLPAERCAGPQSFRYGVAGRDGYSGEVIAVVRLEDPAQSQVPANAQRDIPTPTPGATRPGVPRGNGDPALLPAQGDAAPELVAVPTVPRPQTGQVPGLAVPSGASAQSGGAGLMVGGSGQTPSIVAPGQDIQAGPALATTDAPLAPPPQPAAASPRQPVAGTAPAPEAGLAAPLGSGAAVSSGNVALAEIGAAPQQPAAGQDHQVQSQTFGLGVGVTRSAPAAIDAADGSGQATDQPSVALGTLIARAAPAEPGPAEIPSPPVLADPVQGGTSAIEPVLPSPGAIAAVQSPVLADPLPGTDDSAAAMPPRPAEPCTMPPTLTLEAKPGGQTEVAVDAPCDAGQVARLGYDTLEFGIRLDARGRGSVTVPGLQPSSDAELRLPSGDGLAFDLPFLDTGQLDRVAMVWDSPVQLDLHAFEFGALSGSDGHVRPTRPRSFDEVRRRGGGYLLTYNPTGGVGQNIRVYTYWRRPGSGTGVVKLMVDFATRSAGIFPDACGAGRFAGPDFRVLRSEAGRVAPPGRRRLAPLDCVAVAGAKRLIGDAVDDMVVLKR